MANWEEQERSGRTLFSSYYGGSDENCVTHQLSEMAS
jgi:hypothetical protein